MISTNGIPSEFETCLLTNIKYLNAKNIKFKNVYFEVDSITDAEGRLFVRQREKERTGELEQLCRDLFFFVAPQYRYAPVSKDFENRMNALGLLEGEGHA